MGPPELDSPQGSPPFSLAAFDWKSIVWALVTAAIGAALTAIADTLLNSVLPDLQNRGLIDGAMFALLATLVHAFRKFITDTRIFRVVLVTVLCGWLTSSSFAEDVVLKGLAPGEYYLKIIVAADGSISAVPLRSVTLGTPTTPPPPTDPGDPPPPTLPPLALHAQQLTKATLLEGGTHLTAGSLSVVYSVVADQVEAGTLPLAQISPALKALSDGVIPAGEALAWSGWRFGIGDALTTKLGTKADAVAALRQVSTGTKSAVNATAERTGKAIDWTALLNLLLPILLKLLEKFLTPM